MAAKKKGAAASVRFTPIGSYPVLNRIKKAALLLQSDSVRFDPSADKKAPLLLQSDSVQFDTIRSSGGKRGCAAASLQFDSVLLSAKKAPSPATSSIRFGSWTAKKVDVLLQSVPSDSVLYRQKRLRCCFSSIRLSSGKIAPTAVLLQSYSVLYRQKKNPLLRTSNPIRSSGVNKRLCCCFSPIQSDSVL